MKFVLTGSSGFIGSHLQRFLESRGHRVFTISRGADLKSMANTLKTSTPDIVIHLASCFIAEHKSTDIENLINSNILFGTQLLEAMRTCECKNLVNTGTIWQQYNGNKNNPVCLYSATKNAFEEILKYYIHAENFRVINLKICDSYGANDKRGKLISKLIESLKTGQEFNLSPGDQRLNLVHINDITRAFEIAALLTTQCVSQDTSTNTYTAAADVSYSIREIASLIEVISGEKLNVNFGSKPYRKREIMVPDIMDPILPNWHAEVSLEKGLKELIHGL